MKSKYKLNRRKLQAEAFRGRKAKAQLSSIGITFKQAVAALDSFFRVVGDAFVAFVDSLDSDDEQTPSKQSNA